MKRKLLILGVALSVALAVVIPLCGTASATSTTHTLPCSFSGSQTLSGSGQVVDPLGVTVSFDFSMELNWIQVASLSTTFDPDLVRQGGSLDPSDSYARLAPGTMSAKWTVSNLWFEFPPPPAPKGLPDIPGFSGSIPGSVIFKAAAPCDLIGGGDFYWVYLESQKVPLLATGAFGPYITMGLAADVVVGPQGIATVRQAIIDGSLIPNGEASLTLGESPITDSLKVPCDVGVGNELIYRLGSLSTTQGLDVTMSIVYDVGALAMGIPIPLSQTTIPVKGGWLVKPITMTCPDVSFDMGAIASHQCITATRMPGDIANPIVSIKPQSQSIYPDQTFTLNIEVNPRGKGVSAVQVSMNFDAKAMRVDKVELGDLLGPDAITAPGYPKIDNTSGNVQIAAARKGPTTTPTQEGVFAKITLTAGNEFVAGGSHLFTLENTQLVDENSRDISGFYEENASVTIKPNEILPIKPPGPIGINPGDVNPVPGVTPQPVKCPEWDIDENGRVGTSDLSILGWDYGRPPVANHRSDINRDGRTELKDLSLLAAHMDECRQCVDSQGHLSNVCVEAARWQDLTGSLNSAGILKQL